jgi:2-phosphosulfolactate phosphatase
MPDDYYIVPSTTVAFLSIVGVHIIRRMVGKSMTAAYAGGESGARAAGRSGSVIVVVDAFRASTTVAVLVSKGARILPAASIEEVASAPAAADALAATFAKERVTVVGCGWEGHRASEDEAAASAILRHFGERGARLDARARSVMEAYRSLPKERLRNTSAVRRLKRLGYRRDLDLCLAEDTVPVVPRLLNGAFVGGRNGGASMCKIPGLRAHPKSQKFALTRGGCARILKPGWADQMLQAPSETAEGRR